MIAVRLNADALDALGRLQQHRRRMQTSRGREADDARENVRSYAVDIVNAIFAEHPELNVGAELLDELLARRDARDAEDHDDGHGFSREAIAEVDHDEMRGA